MKRISFVLSICLFLSTLLMSLSMVTSFAIDEIAEDVLNDEAHNAYLEEALSEETTYESSISEYDSFLVSYFDNLTYNFGVNYKGSCGYVAIAMLLSYYDTYLNDEIIPEQYDINSMGYTTNMINRRNSPGTMRDIIANPNNSYDYNYARRLSSNDYYTNIASLENTSLHAKLIMIAASRGYYNFSNNDNPAGTLFEKRYNVLQDYLSDIETISSTDYQISSINHESDSTKSSFVKQFAINQVLDGNPVLLSVRGENGGHVVVAYDYDEDTEELYCHMGWGANTTHVTPESQGFSIYRTALVLDFNIAHSHSNNYGVTTITNNVPSSVYYCYENCDILSYIEKTHDYSNFYVSYSNYCHYSYCECGSFVIEDHILSNNVCSLCNTVHTHSYIYAQHNLVNHKYECACGETGYISHNFVYLPNEALNHKSLCDDCGYYRTEPHITSPSFNNGKTCIKCFMNVGSGGSLLNSVVGIAYYITDNGSYVRSDGIIVLSAQDYELYLAVELDLDSLLSQGGVTQ